MSPVFDKDISRSKKNDSFLSEPFYLSSILCFTLAICSIYGIFTNIYHKHKPNVAKYSSHMEHLGGTQWPSLPLPKTNTTNDHWYQAWHGCKKELADESLWLLANPTFTTLGPRELLGTQRAWMFLCFPWVFLKRIHGHVWLSVCLSTDLKKEKVQYPTLPI